MAYTYLDYLEKDWSPVPTVRAQPLASDWWYKPWSNGGRTSGIYVPGLPTAQVPSPNAFVRAAFDRFSALTGVGDTRTDLQRMWDHTAYYSLSRDPALAPTWTHLSGSFSILDDARWSDFRRSNDFAPAVRTLAVGGGGMLGKAATTVGRFAKTGVKWTRLSPEGLAVWAAESLIWDLGKWGVTKTWKSWQQYNRERQKADRGGPLDPRNPASHRPVDPRGHFDLEYAPQLEEGVLEAADAWLESVEIATPLAYADPEDGFASLTRPADLDAGPFLFSSQPQGGLPGVLVDFDTFLR